MTNYTNIFYIYIYICMQNHNDDTIKKSGYNSLEKYTSHFTWKGCVWEVVGDRTELQQIDPHSIGHNRVSFSLSWADQQGAWGPSPSGTCSSIQHLLSNSSGLQNWLIGGLRAPSAGCWLSRSHLVSNWSGLQNWLIGGLRVPSAGCWLSLPHLVSNWLNFQCLSYIIVHAHLLLVGVTNCTHSTHPRSRLYSAIPQPDVPVIYTGGFPILTAWLGQYTTQLPLCKGVRFLQQLS